jgi:hypothetical protein
MAFNKAISASRQITMATLNQDRFSSIAAAIGGTLNDAVAVVLGTSLRSYLADTGQRPDSTLIAGVLTSLRSAMAGAGGSAGNVISFIFADLATDTDEVAARADRVIRSTKAGKRHLFGLGSNALNYTVLMLAPYLLFNIAGIGHQGPMYNILQSNLPGLKDQRYFHGAAADGMFPTTIIYNGAAVAFIIVSWNGKLCFTFVACPDVVPRADALTDYLVAATAQVEAALSL